MYVVTGGTKPLCFICHPKTGSQSLRVAFNQLRAVDVSGHHHIDEAACKVVKSDDGIVACTVRNPFDVFVSWYYYSHVNVNRKANKPVLPFHQWLPQVIATGNKWIEKGLFYGAHLCNRIIRFEDGIQEQFSRILLDCGLPDVRLEVKGKSNDLATYRILYNNRTRRMVADYCASELETFGYEF